jgi:hypothetical protein
MSEDTKIQTSSPNELSGGQAPLTERRGNEGLNQNTMSFCRGVEVPASSGATERRFQQGQVNGVSGRAESCTSNGLAVAGREAETAKHVDQRCVEGSYPGDSRKRGADAVLPANPPVRGATGQSGA